MHDVQAHQRGEADRRAHVVGKDEEGGAVRNGSAMRGHAVRDRAHRVLAHAEMQVPPRVAPAAAGGSLHVEPVPRGRFEIAQALQRRVGGRIEIGRSPRQRGHARRERVHHLARCGARGHALGVGGKRRDVRVPAGCELAAHGALQLLGFGGIGARVGAHAIAPRRFVARAARERLAEVRERGVGNQELRVLGPAEASLGEAHLVRAQRGAVRLEAVVLVGGAVADVGAHEDERGPRRLRTRGGERRVDRREVVAVGDRGRVPAVSFEAPRAVLGKRDVGAGGERHAVVVVEAGELAEPQVPRERGRLGGHTLHEIAVARDHVGRVVDHRVVRAVVARRELRLGDRHAHGIGETLPEGPRGGFHSGRVPTLGMARRLAAPLAKALDLLQWQVVAGKVQEAIEQHRAVPRREHEAVAIEPRGVARVVLEHAHPQRVGHGCRVERQARVAAIGLLHRIDRQEAQGIDAEPVELLRHDRALPPSWR